MKTALHTTHRLILENSQRMGVLPDNSIDLLVTSPPYPMIAMWDEQFRTASPAVSRHLDSEDGDAAFEAMHLVLDRVWLECLRVMKKGAVACINIGDAVRSVGGRFRLFANHSRVQRTFSELGFDILPPVLWRKQTNAPSKFMGSGMLPGGAYVTLEHEFILLCRKGSKRVFNTAEGKENRLRSAYFWEERNRWFSDLWELKGARQRLDRQGQRDRSGAFPLVLPFRLINMYSLLGDRVLDPFAGMGTTILAAAAAGRDSIGYEIESSFSASLRKGFGTGAQSLRAYNLHRVEAHLAFVQSCKENGKELRHFNSFFQFPVMTGQERKLRLVFPQTVQETAPDCYRVGYFADHNLCGVNPAHLAAHLSAGGQIDEI